jgi:peptidoglycan/LPS O-acetylase OafA/YrhL
MMATRVYSNVQVLRAVAALMVALGHAGALQVFSYQYDPLVVAPAGVDMFFCISGFIICGTAVQPGNSAWRFAVKRIVRIFPIYWIVLAVCVVILPKLVIPGQAPIAFNLPPINMIFLWQEYNSFVPQAWTLMYEVYFYAWFCFVLLIAPGKVWPMVGALMALQAGAIVVTLWQGHDPNRSILTSWLVLEFGFGCAVAYVCRTIAKPRLGGLAFLVGIVLLVAGTIIRKDNSGDISRPAEVATWGVGSALILYAAICLELRNRSMLPQILRRLGDASYSIYLWHMIVMKIIITVIPLSTVPTPLTRNIYGTGVMLVVIGVGFASYTLIEAPIVRSVSRRLATFGRAKSPESTLYGFDKNRV